MKKIAITGANGIIGTILTKGLTDYHITPLVKPHIDVRNLRQVSQAIKGQDVVIHLAWDTKRDNMSSEEMNPDNSEMFYNVYQAAFEQKISRIIMASSVHADSFYDWKGQNLLSPEKTPVPDGIYGAHKVFMEAMGRYYATKEVEVVCIRFGGVNLQDTPNGTFAPERAVYFSHRDCINLIKAIIETPKIPNNFSLVYGISNSEGRMHDITNPFGWKPS